MNCTKCGSYLDDGSEFCTSCGAKVNTQPSNAVPNNTEYANPGNSYTSSGFNQNSAGASGYQAPVQPIYQQTQMYQNPADKVPTLGEYIKWMFLYPLFSLIPIVGFIIYIVMCFKNAFDTSYKARANYFKAMLIIWLISIGIFVVVGILIAVLVTTGMFAFSDIGYYL